MPEQIRRPKLESLVPTTRSARVNKIPSRLEDFYLHIAETAPQVSFPTNIEAALLHPGWKLDIDDELASIYKNGTWDLILPLHEKKAITTKWVYRVITNVDGSTAKLKARLVPKASNRNLDKTRLRHSPL